jgi:AraC-like DNA-binding protein
MSASHGDASPKPSFPAAELPQGAKPFRRGSVRGVAVDIFVEHAAPNVWSAHRHDTWQVVIPFDPAICDATWWLPTGRRVQRRIQGGDVWILPPRWKHSQRWREYADVIVLYPDAEEVHRQFASLPKEARVASLNELVTGIPVIAELCLELREFAFEPPGKKDWRLAGAGTHLAALVLEALNLQTRQLPVRSSGVAGEVLARVKTYLDERKNDRVAVCAMAQELGISTRHLRRVFRRMTGKSPQEWVTAQKAARAKTLLRAGHNPKTVAIDAGFSDTRHLRRVLRMCYGVTPTAFVPDTRVRPVHPGSGPIVALPC